MTKTRSRIRALAWLTVLLQAHLLALAMPKAEAASEGASSTDARASYRQGETAYKLGEFEEALHFFSRAYELNPIPGFLFNIGQCHYNLKSYERAIFFYEGYLRDFPAAPNRVATQTQIAAAKRELAKQERLAARKTPAPAPVVVESSSAPVMVKPMLSAPAAEPFAASAPVAQVDAHTPVYKTWWLWTIVAVVVVGGAAAATAIALQPKDKTVLPQGSLSTIDLRGQ